MKQYDRFARVLNTAITQSGLQKNEMIRILEIDRSSYFQFLKGNRLPTKEQYNMLKKILLLPKEDMVQMDEQYYRAVLGEDVWENIQQVRHCVGILAERHEIDAIRESIASSDEQNLPSDNGLLIRYLQSHDEVKKAVADILAEAITADGLDFYIPISADAFFDQMGRMMTKGGHRIRMRWLTGLRGGRIDDQKEAMSVFQGLLFFLSAQTDIHLECRYYYNSVSKVSDIGLLYPWYILTGKNVLMISQDFRKAVCVQDEQFAKAYADRFEQAFADSTPMLKNYGSLEQNLQAIREFLKGKREVNYEAIPCTAMIATPEMIRKYVIPQAQEALIAHCSALQRDETMIDVSSISGLGTFLKTRKIPEIPEAYMREVEPEDLIWYVDNLLKRLGSTLFIIDEDRILPAYDWDITIIEEYSVLIHHHNYETIIIDEKNIVDIFTSFARNILESPFVLDAEKARKELLKIRTGLVREIQSDSVNI